MSTNIATHTPAPRAFKPGDRVTFWDMCDDRRYIGKILSIDGDCAWVMAQASRATITVTVALSDLHHADERE
jgi:hypothetical protein